MWIFNLGLHSVPKGKQRELTRYGRRKLQLLWQEKIITYDAVAYEGLSRVRKGGDNIPYWE